MSTLCTRFELNFALDLTTKRFSTRPKLQTIPRKLYGIILMENEPKYLFIFVLESMCPIELENNCVIM